jgi:D-xylose transport system permease protein
MDSKSGFLKDAFQRNIRQYTMLFALVAIWVIFTVLTDGIFIKPGNLSNLFLQTMTVAVVAIGMTLIIVTGNIDLSVGSVAALAGAVGAYCQVRLGWDTAPALMAAVGCGLLIGLWHGFWVAYRMVPSFIVTLASMLIFRGAVLGVTGGTTIAPLSESFKALGQDYINPTLSAIIGVVSILLFCIFELRRRFRRAKYGFEVPSWPMQLLKLAFGSAVGIAFFGILVFNEGVPYSVLLVLVLAVVFHFVSNHTVFGRHLYAIGGNADAAKLSGINNKKRILQLFTVFGAITALGGLVLTSRLNAATTSAGQGMELDVIAAVVIGGTSLLGGEGTILGSLVGALIMASLDNGMSLMDTNITYQYVIKGLILLFAVWVDMATRKK